MWKNNDHTYATYYIVLLSMSTKCVATNSMYGFYFSFCTSTYRHISDNSDHLITTMCFLLQLRDELVRQGLPSCHSELREESLTGSYSHSDPCWLSFIIYWLLQGNLEFFQLPARAKTQWSAVLLFFIHWIDYMGIFLFLSSSFILQIYLSEWTLFITHITSM